MNYLFEAGIGNQIGGWSYIERRVVASGIGRGLVVQSGDWLSGRTGVGRNKRDLSMGASGIQRRYSGVDRG